MKRMIKLAIALIIALVPALLVLADEIAPVQQDITIHKMEATAYCLQGQRCDGGMVREGIASAAPEYYGLTAAVYENDNGKLGEFLGYYEILDTGGAVGIKNGTVIDIWIPTKAEALEFGRKDVLVIFYKGVG